MIKLNFLGSFQLHVDGAEVPFDNVRRIPALLACAVLNRDEPMDRRHLAYLFWPDSNERQARTNLRKVLFTLRKGWPTVADHLAVERSRVLWHGRTEDDVDIVRFELALAHAEDAEAQGDAVGMEEALIEAIGAYGGDLLPGTYDEWLLLARDRLQKCYCRALDQLCSLLETKREFAQALVYAEQLVQADPLQETGYVRLMQLYAAKGDRAAALRTYHQCATLLERELNTEPGGNVRELYNRLRMVDEGGGENPQTLGYAVPLVGRHGEWQTLMDVWRRVLDGEARFCLITGEAGIGKTRLAEELVDRLRRQGHIVASSRAYAAGGSFAYGPVAEWLRKKEFRGVIHSLDSVWQVELSRILPELQAEIPGLGTPGPLQEGWQRQRFFDSVVRVLTGAEASTLLHLDDLQWCDAETLNLLHYLLRATGGAKVMIVGTARSEEVGEGDPLSRLLWVLRQDDLVVEIRLDALSSAESAVLADQVCGKELSPAVHGHLYRQSEGHPLFLQEILRARGSPDSWDEGNTTEDSGLDVLSVARLPRIQAIIGARLAQLTPHARELAQVAAVVGREFSFAVLAAAGNLDEETLTLALDELWRRRIVREQGEEGYDFSHDRIREVAYAELSLVRQRRVHRRVAQALCELHSAHLDAVSGELAFHYEACGDRTQAVAWYLQAGEVALATYAGKRALQCFARTLRLVDGPDAPESVLFGLGRAHFALDQLAETVEYFEQALATGNEKSSLRPKILYALADAHMARFLPDEAEPFAQQALDTAEAIGDQETVCQALSLLGQIHSQRGDLTRESQLIQRALTTARQTGNRWREGRTLADMGFLQAQFGDFAGAADSARAAIDLLRPSGDQGGLAFAWNILGRAEGGRGGYDVALDAFDRSGELATAIGLHSIAAQIPNMRGWLFHQLGEFETAHAENKQGLAVALEANKDTAEISSRLNLCLDAIYLGRPLDGLQSLEAIEARLALNDFGFHGWRWRLRLLHSKGLAYLRLGRFAEIWRCVEAGMQLAQQTRAVKYCAFNHELAGLVYLATGEANEANAHLERAMTLADQIGYVPLRREARLRLAGLYTLNGQQTAAGQMLEQAHEIAEAVAAQMGDTAVRRRFLAQAGTCAIEIDGAVGEFRTSHAG